MIGMLNSSHRIQAHLMRVGHCRHCERLTYAAGSWRIVQFPSICALLIHPRHGAALFDTGYSERFFAATQRFPERLYRWITPTTLPPEETLTAQLARLGLHPSDIRICLISHLHADHIAGLRDLPRARFVLMRTEWTLACRQSRLSGLRHGFLPALLPDDFAARLQWADDFPRRPLPSGWSALGDGHDVWGDQSLLALTLPGHTAGQMGLLFRDPLDREVFLCADACWSRQAWLNNVPPSRLAGVIMHDRSVYRRTLESLHRLGAQHPELFILPSHCQQSMDLYHADGRNC
jgi:glyoxylase-like metal-dependent hydrolase (beta-lactamase superfamily II)